jgi:N-acetylglucosaminyl-diphospho-decaprenol L-rhamnosyltransferase
MNEHLDGSQELIVVDNASTDSPGAAAAEWKGNHRFLALDDNLGFGRASNEGVRAATQPTTVLLNPDTELLDAGLDRLADATAGRWALVGPRVLNADGTVQPSASGPEVGPWPWVRALVPAALQPEAVRQHTEPYRLERRVRVAWLTGACIAAPTAVLRGLGPFDPALSMYGEDVDLGLRAAAAGVGSWFDPTVCRVVHHGQGSSPLAYGSREGWRPHGTLNWRAALRRAYGSRREWLAWRALRLNLRLRLITKTLLGRAGERDRSALAAALAADPPPRLPER